MLILTQWLMLKLLLLLVLTFLVIIEPVVVLNVLNSDQVFIILLSAECSSRLLGFFDNKDEECY